MHILFVIIAVPGVLLCTEILGRLQTAGSNRLSVVAKWQMIAPVAGLWVALSSLKDVIAQVCALASWPWLIGALVISIAGASAIAILATCLGLARVWFATRGMLRGAVSHTNLQNMADEQSRKLGLKRVQAYVRFSDEPIAHTWGVWRPKLLLSTWMLQNLDADELTAVIVHELGHMARRDALKLWIITLLRDAFFYLPAVRTSYTSIRQSFEAQADELATRLTGEPLALASALAKVWQHVADRRIAVLSFAGAGGGDADDAIEARITRLIAQSDGFSVSNQASRACADSRYARILKWLVLGLLAANFLVMTLPNGCLPLVNICAR